MKEKLLVVPFQVLLLFCAVEGRAKEFPPKAHRGTLDLSSWQFVDKGPVGLDGQWEFHWHQFLSDGQKSESPPAFLELPNIWNGEKIDAQTLGSYGFGTYRLKLILPPQRPGLALEIPALYCSYNLWLNGEKIASNGTVGTTREGCTPRWLPITKKVTVEEDTTEILLEVSNFHHRYGGVPDQLLLGPEQGLLLKREKEIISSAILMGALGFIGVFFLVNFIYFRVVYKRRDKAFLYFSLFALVWTVRAFFTKLYMALIIFPEMDWRFTSKVEYITLYLAIIFALLYLSHSFRDDSNSIFTNILVILNYLFIAVTMSTGSEVFTFMLPIYQVFVVAVVIYALYVVVMAVINERPQAWLMVASIAVACVVVMLDLFTYRNILRDNAFLINLGYLTFFMLNSIALSARFIEILKGNYRHYNLAYS